MEDMEPWQLVVLTAIIVRAIDWILANRERITGIPVPTTSNVIRLKI